MGTWSVDYKVVMVNSSRSCYTYFHVFLKWLSPAFFHLFSFFSVNFQNKTVYFNRIRTRMGIEGEHADHLTTTTALSPILSYPTTKKNKIDLQQRQRRRWWSDVSRTTLNKINFFKSFSTISIRRRRLRRRRCADRKTFGRIDGERERENKWDV